MSVRSLRTPSEINDLFAMRNKLPASGLEGLTKGDQGRQREHLTNRAISCSSRKGRREVMTWQAGVPENVRRQSCMEERVDASGGFEGARRQRPRVVGRNKVWAGQAILQRHVRKSAARNANGSSRLNFVIETGLQMDASSRGCFGEDRLLERGSGDAKPG
jgi:hypothetical protein